MIIERTFYSLKCNGCGRELEDDAEEYAWTDDQKATEDVAVGGEWMCIRGKHFCPDCHHRDDNDNLVLGDGTVITQEEDDWI